MNTHEFSIQRFGLLLKSEIDRNRKEILIFIGLILGLYLISPINDGTFSTDSFTAYIGFATLALPFVLYKNLFHNTKGLAWGMLPASQTEKFLVLFVICTLAVPIGMLVFAWFVSLIGLGLTGRPEMMFDFWRLFTSHSRLGFFDSYIWEIIGMQSIAIWGVCFFKSGKFWKTVLASMCAGLALVIVVSIYGIRLHHSGLLFNDFYLEEPVTTRLALIGDIFCSIVLPVLLWAWSFLKIRRQQF